MTIKSMPTNDEYRSGYSRIWDKRLVPELEDRTTLERPCCGENYVDRGHGLSYNIGVVKTVNGDIEI
jgi:hypothetical protein